MRFTVLLLLAALCFAEPRRLWDGGGLARIGKVAAGPLAAKGIAGLVREADYCKAKG